MLPFSASTNARTVALFSTSLVVLACGGGRSGSATAAGPGIPTRSQDVSGRAGGISIQIDGRERIATDFGGVVTSIAAPTGTAGIEAWTGVELGTARFLVWVDPPELGLPFAVGDAITARIDCTRGGHQRVCDGWIRDARGEALLVVSDSGSSPFEGFAARPGPEGTRDERGRVTSGMVVERSGASVTTEPSVWQTIDATDGSWLVTGRAERATGERLPGMVDSTRFCAVRLRVAR